MTGDVKTTTAAENDISALTDKYFARTRETVARHGDKTVTYAVFMRRPVRFATRIAVEWIREIARRRNIKVDIEERFKEGEEAGGGEPLLYITGSFVDLVDMETLYLQKIGAACVAAMNAYDMCTAMPRSGFMALTISRYTCEIARGLL